MAPSLVKARFWRFDIWTKSPRMAKSLALFNCTSSLTDVPARSDRLLPSLQRGAQAVSSPENGSQSAKV